MYDTYLLTYLLTHFYSLIVCWAVQRRLFCSYFLCCINLKLLCELWSWNSDENVHFLALPPPSVSQSVCQSISQSVCLSVCLSVYMKLSVCTSVCLSPINSLVYHYMSYIFIISVMPAGSVSAHNSFTLTECWEVPLYRSYQANNHNLLQFTFISHALKGDKCGDWNWK